MSFSRTMEAFASFNLGSEAGCSAWALIWLEEFPGGEAGEVGTRFVDLGTSS